MEEVIEDDQQVMMLREYQRLEVNFRGRPDPGMSMFASQLAEVQKTQAGRVYTSSTHSFIRDCLIIEYPVHDGCERLEAQNESSRAAAYVVYLVG